jgi:hypothetical protein
MRRFILALPVVLAFAALLPMFAFFAVVFSKLVFGTGIPAVIYSSAFAHLVFDGITAAALFFLVSILSLIAEYH